MLMLFKKIICVLVLFCFFAYGKVGDWYNFGRTSPINDAVLINNDLWLATDGGLRKIPKSLELGDYYGPLNGLSSANIQVLLKDDLNVLYAIDKSGIINECFNKNNSCKIINSSFKAKNFQLVDNASQYYQGYLIIAFKSRLTFFNIAEKRSILSMSKIGDSNLELTPLTDINVKNDTVYASVGTKLYKRKVDFDNIDDDFTLPNPGSWDLVDDYNFQINNLYFKNDTIVVDSLEGFYKEVDGKVWSSLIGNNNKVIVDNQELNDSSLYTETNISDEVILSSNVFYMAEGKEFNWLVSNSAIIIQREDSLEFKSPLHLWPASNAHNLVLSKTNTLFAWSLNSTVFFNGDYFVMTPIKMGTGSMDPLRALNDVYKGLTIDNDDNLVISTWGAGILWRENGGIDNFNPPMDQYGYGNSCIEDFVEKGYTISVGAASADFIDGVFVNYFPDKQGNNKYGLAYINSIGDVYCARNIGTGNYPRNILVTKYNEEIYLYVSSSDEMDDALYSWVDMFKVNDIDGSGDYDYDLVSTISTGEFGTVHDMEQDSSGRIWVMSRENVGYLEQDYLNGLGRDTVIALEGQAKPKVGGYNAIELAGYDKLWLATAVDGVFRFDLQDKVDDISFTSYTVKDGLLSDVVYDIATNDQNGIIWFGHDIGISAYESLDRLTNGFQEEGSEDVIVFPNPFRPGVHLYLTMDNVSPDATIRILNSSGNVIVDFKGDVLDGGMLKWNGKNKSGSYVSAGVYHYTITEVDKPKQGKIIILR